MNIEQIKEELKNNFPDNQYSIQHTWTSHQDEMYDCYTISLKDYFGDAYYTTIETKEELEKWIQNVKIQQKSML